MYLFHLEGIKEIQNEQRKTNDPPPKKNHFVFTFLSHRKNDECPNFLSMKLLLKLGASTNKKLKYKRISELI